MKWNASLAALSALLLAGCGTSRGGESWAYTPGQYPANRYSQDQVPQQPYSQPGSDTAQPDRYSQPYGARPQSSGVDADIQPRYPAAGQGAGASYAPPGASGQPYARQQYPTQQDYGQGGPPPSAGPQGSSRPQADEVRYDEVGYAELRGVASGDPSAARQVVAVHPRLAPGSFVEVTALDSGRTILVMITGRMQGGRSIIALSPGAAQQLGISSVAGVRVRSVTPPAQDEAALRAGGAAPARIDAPESLLVPLRKQLGAAPPATVAGPSPYAQQPPASESSQPGAAYQPPYRPTPSASPPSGGGFFVQVAALSNAARAQELAQSLGGFVEPTRGLYRVRMGPYPSRTAAEGGRAIAVRRGFGDARIVTP
ncbi:SPOR domain-containing protein [Stakelama tenebrarum]|uniref:SPOR domain-containing protein n=1 Tax=Stakelama tenebrarum TaxID=2711215 RepID=A0A6G6Y5W3_9SPHN|nr:SPOR domain-containing protein [Sphingosinithalassobacter tenebrarum]QIG80289.1 hypothetical protein G5C33_11225 [Sphingosinithalassobacter tenebrarum]